ncbi:MAG: hypothetical protein AAF911_03660 [Planctomycetota bacterium]
MSYDIFFWKQSKRLKATPESIYVRLNDGQKVRGVDDLPVDEIVDRLRELLAGFDPAPTTKGGFGSASADDVEVAWGSRYFRFDARFTQELHDQIVDFMMGFGCALYAPAADRHHVQTDGFTPYKPKPPKVDIKVKVTRVVQRSARELEIQIPPLPATTKLVAADPEAFHPSFIARNTRAEYRQRVEAVGYREIGTFSAEGTGVLIEAFYRSPNLFACNYEHPATGTGWDEIICVNKDETLTLWSSELIDNHVPPWVTRNPVIGPFYDRDRIVLAALEGQALPEVPADRFVSLAESYYAKEMAWRADL